MYTKSILLTLRADLYLTSALFLILNQPLGNYIGGKISTIL